MRSFTRTALSVRLLLLVSSLGTALLASGCGAATTTLSGEVTLNDGKPLPFGRVRAVCMGGSQPVVPGVIRDGKFSLPNVAVGEVKLEIETVPPPPEKDPNIKEIKMSGDAKKEEGPYVEINSKYSNVKTSGLVFQVQSGQEPIKIKLDPFVPRN